MFNQIPVFYHPSQVADPESFSKSPLKPRDVVAEWQDKGFPIRIVTPTPVTREQLALAHDRDHVDAILDLRKRDGFGARKADVAASFPWTSGSFLSASREALANGQVAVSPTSGFHHASYDHCHGFCTFNGLMVATVVLLGEGLVKKVGILDCDEHYGDGTVDIIKRLGLQSSVRHVTAGSGYVSEAHAFLSALPGLVEAFADCDLLMYQAGADPHVNDPYGGYLTDLQLLERDRIVFRTTARLGIPLVWNLAGGYQDPLAKVIAIHANTMHACVEAYFDQSEDAAAEQIEQPRGTQN